jgi:HEPN domain-containing protein
MNLRKLAEDYIRRAEVRLESAKMALRSRDFPDVVRFSQESVELSLKAALRAYGVECAKEHDVGEVLVSVSERFPEWFREKAEDFAEISSDLASKRSAALYGLELEGKGPAELLGREEAVRALEDAERVVGAAMKLLRE